MLQKADNTIGKIVTAGQVVTFTLSARDTTGRPATKDTVVVDCVPAGLTFGAYGDADAGQHRCDAPGTGTNGCAGGHDAPAVGRRHARRAATLTYTATVDPASAGPTSYPTPRL